MSNASDAPRGRMDRADDDAAIIAGSLDDPERFGALFDRHGRAIHRYLARRVGRSDADDLLAEVFVAAFRARDRYDLTRPDALPWLYGIAANLTARTFRSRTRAAAATQRMAKREPAEVDLQDGQVDRLDAEAGWPELAAALDALGDAAREALLLHVWEDLSYEEIAVATAVPIGTVRSRISRARATLRELLAAQRETTERKRTRAPHDEDRTDGT